MRITHLSFECSPIYKTGGLGDVVGSLPKALEKLGVDNQVIMPGYGWIVRQPTLPHSKVKIEYIDSPFFKHQVELKKPQIQAQAFAHFCLLILEKIKIDGIAPDIIQCHDWHTALVPFLLKKYPDPFFAKTKTILTIHNVAFQGNFQMKYLSHQDLKILTDLIDPRVKKFSFLKEGIKNADFITTVSPNHAQEIMAGKVSFGLQQVLRPKKSKFMGILNGIDTDVWNPASDDLIFRKYSVSSFKTAKYLNKVKLQAELGLIEDPEIPIFGFIARLSSQKGVEFIIPLMEQAARRRIEVIILGKGSESMEKSLSMFDNKIKGSWVSVNLAFDERLAHKIYAGVDFFLIPSRFEPCGLTQMISMRYGTIPIASKTGGLKDSIENGETGFLLNETTDRDFLKQVDNALELFMEKQKLFKMIEKVMQVDFSWDKPAKKYLALYHQILK